MADGKFEKPASMGVSLESGYFSEEGGSGFGLSTYAGRLSLRFWKKGEKSSENKDNTVSLNLNQALLLSQMLRFIVGNRLVALKSGGIEKYPDVTGFGLTLDGSVNGQIMVFGVIRFDTVSVDGVRRVRMTVIRNKTENTITFCDRFLKGAIEDGGAGFKSEYDPMDISIIRFAQEVEAYVAMQWQYASMNKIFNAIIKPNGGGNNGGNRSSGGSGYSQPNRRYDSEASPVFDDSGDDGF